MQILQSSGVKTARLFLAVRKIPCLIRECKYSVRLTSWIASANDNLNIDRKIFNIFLLNALLGKSQSNPCKDVTVELLSVCIFYNPKSEKIPIKMLCNVNKTDIFYSKHFSRSKLVVILYDDNVNSLPWRYKILKYTYFFRLYFMG